MKTYKPPLPFYNGHLLTIYPSLFRKVEGVTYEREKIATPDDDFLLLDWSKAGGEELAIISHGLEGHTERKYMRGMVKAANSAGIDALAWNYRGCGGETNNKFRLYHNGATDDLHTVISHAIKTGYEKIHLVGFSMGGNISLLYLGKDHETVPENIKSCSVFSVPCDLTDASIALASPSCKIYMKRFLRMLKEKVEAKHAQFPDKICIDGYGELTDFKGFDERYTAPVHGFESAEDYWQKCSSRPHLKNIKIPTLIVNALDDPFLTGGCYPYDECRINANVILETPKHGGHVGFQLRGDTYWSEFRAVDFIKKST